MLLYPILAFFFFFPDIQWHFLALWCLVLEQFVKQEDLSLRYISFAFITALPLTERRDLLEERSAAEDSD